MALVCHNDLIEKAIRKIVYIVGAEKAPFHEHTGFRKRPHELPFQPTVALSLPCCQKQEWSAGSSGDPEAHPTPLFVSRQAAHSQTGR